MTQKQHKQILAGLAAVLLIGLIWIVAVIIGRGLTLLEPDPATLQTWLQANDPQQMTVDARDEFLSEYARRVNRLSWEQRRQLQTDPVFEKRFTQMTPDERSRFVDATMPQGMRQMMEAINRMDRNDRERLVQRALSDLERNNAGELDQRLREEDARRIIEQGLKTYYEEATPESRLQLAPLLEQLQRRLQRTR